MLVVPRWHQCAWQYCALFAADYFLRASQPMQADGQFNLRAMGGRTLDAHAKPTDACRPNQVGHCDRSCF